MQTASSANRTWSARASASECTATVFTPSSRQALKIRSAISPRFAMRIFLNMIALVISRLLDAKELLPVLHAFTILREDFDDRASALGLDFIHQLHRLDDAKSLSC